MITLDYRDRRPLYEQVIERFQDLMFKGVLVQDEKMPSVRSLATDLSINPNTIQRAYAELERQGFIYSIKGKGSFVADTGRMKAGRIREWERSFDGLVEEAGQLGIGCETVVERVRRKCVWPHRHQRRGQVHVPAVDERRSEAGGRPCDHRRARGVREHGGQAAFLLYIG